MADEKNDTVGSGFGAGILIAGELIKAAGNDPKTKEAASNLAQAAVTITKTLNVVLLPLAAVNFAYDRAKKYFQDGGFEADLRAKTSSIPPEDIVEPKASVAGPAIQALAFSHEETLLKELYLNLLRSAMDGRVAGSAHPAFVEIIKQLTSSEASLLKNILSASAIPVVEVRLNTVDDSGYDVLMRNVFNYIDNGLPVLLEGLPAMVDNWSRLGLIEVDMMTHFVDGGAYEWVDSRPEIIALKAKQGNERAIDFGRGIMRRTAFGHQFAKVVGILESANVTVRVNL